MSLPRTKTSPKILVIDDETSIGQMLQDTLEMFQFEVRLTDSYESALEEFARYKPTIALIDIRLGERDGVELADELRKIDPHLAVILMTAYPTMELAMTLMEKGIQDFLAKPIDKAYLLQSVRNATKKRNMTEENQDLLLYLKAANASLARLNEMKNKFLSIVSHDLRSPLSAIQGYCDLLENNPNLPKEKRDRSFRVLKDSIQQMIFLISNLMDMAGIEAGKLKVAEIPMDYSVFCKNACEAFVPMAAVRKLTFTCTAPDEPLMVLGDSNRLNQLLTNLISNAFKHTLQGGKVEVRVIKDTNCIVTEVADNGEGIPKESQARIFEQYYQLDTSASRGKGMGLGLFISKEIVQSHKGEIKVMSDGLGKGATFSFTLPLFNA